jgi:DNA-binding transcriptional LysR family regulator
VPGFDFVDSGELVEVMPAFRAGSVPIAVVYPHRRQRSRRLAAFVECLEALVKPHQES